jgi:DNA-binding CsgD family transcriptional regulator
VRSGSDAWPIVARDAAEDEVVAALLARPARLRLIEGAAGVGKSALAAAATARSGRDVAVVVGYPDRSAIPLGAFDDVLRELGDVDGEAAVAAVVGSLGRAPSRRLLLVDDAPRLDDASAEVVRRLVGGLGIPVVATARLGEVLPHPLQRLDEEGLVERHRLEGLTVGEVADILETFFRVPAGDADVHRLMWETDGNPLHVRVLVESAVEAGEVLHRGTSVEFRREDPPTGLGGVIAARIDTLTVDQHRLLRLIALTQPVALPLITVSPEREEALAVLRRRGLVAPAGPRRVSVAHPLIAEALEDAGDVEEAIRLLRASGEPSRRFAAVELERRSVRTSAATELVWAAAYASARGDHRTAADLADTAAAQPARRADVFAAVLAAASYHSLARSLDDADRLFEQAAGLATDPGERAALASSLGEHLAARRRDPDAAVAQGELARATLNEREAVALDADLWRWRVLAGLGGGGSGPAVEAEVRDAIAAVVAASMRGEPAAALAAATPLELPRALLGALRSTAAIASGLQRIVELRSLGRADAAAEYLESARAQADEALGFFTVMLAGQRAQEGRLADALRLAELAVEQLRRSDDGELLALALALRATVNAQSGEHATARAQLEELSEVTVSGAAVLQRAECEAFLLAADGDLRGAARVIVAVVADAISSGYRFLGALTLANALRFGEVARTAELAQQLCAVMSEHVEPCVALRDLAVALDRGKPELVGAAARRLARAGLAPAAIDGISIALGMPVGEEHRRRLQSLATALASEVDAPLLQRRELPSLTPRELEVARVAAQRLRAREIGEHLGVSARTVENQLYSIYRKLGVGSRDELRDALAEAGLLAAGEADTREAHGAA